MTFGGVNGKQEPVDTVEIYDVDKKEWEGSDVVDTMRERVLGLSAVLRGQCSVFFCYVHTYFQTYPCNQKTPRNGLFIFKYLDFYR